MYKLRTPQVPSGRDSFAGDADDDTLSDVGDILMDAPSPMCTAKPTDGVASYGDCAHVFHLADTVEHIHIGANVVGQRWADSIISVSPISLASTLAKLLLQYESISSPRVIPPNEVFGCVVKVAMGHKSGDVYQRALVALRMKRHAVSPYPGPAQASVSTGPLVSSGSVQYRAIAAAAPMQLGASSSGIGDQTQATTILPTAPQLAIATARDVFAEVTLHTPLLGEEVLFEDQLPGVHDPLHPLIAGALSLNSDSAADILTLIHELHSASLGGKHFTLAPDGVRIAVRALLSEKSTAGVAADGHHVYRVNPVAWFLMHGAPIVSQHWRSDDRRLSPASTEYIGKRDLADVHIVCTRDFALYVLSKVTETRRRFFPMANQGDCIEMALYPSQVPSGSQADGDQGSSKDGRSSAQAPATAIDVVCHVTIATYRVVHRGF